MATNPLFLQTPALEDASRIDVPDYPLKGIPELEFSQPRVAPSRSRVPDDAACRALWDKYDMLDNIRAHSMVVARVATALARHAASRGLPVDVPSVRASALLHDIAKTYCVRNGGGHAQLGAAWVVQETGNYAIAGGVFHHVFWPWPLPVDDPVRMCSLPFFIMYADKRARHDCFVSLEDRFADLYERYGTSEKHKAGIYASYLQAKGIEQALSKHLGVGLSHTIPV